MYMYMYMYMYTYFHHGPPVCDQNLKLAELLYSDYISIASGPLPANCVLS